MTYREQEQGHEEPKRGDESIDHLNESLTQPCVEVDWGEEKAEEAEESLSHDCWGLLRRKGVDQECRLLHREKKEARDTYEIGRSDSCDIVIRDSRVSSVHCKIYCAYSDEDMLTMYVEDCSAYGTFVNSSLVRLENGQRTVLNSGDEIFLMNPRFVKGPELVSFVFINMRERMFASKKVSMPPGTVGQAPYGSRIEDHYVIGEAIGSGMCGQVRICTHKATKKQWAVKIIDTKKFNKTPGLSVEDLRQEADLMRVLNHPNIIRIEDTFVTSSHIFIVMELVSGGDLFDNIIDKGKLSEPRARHVMRMLLEAVKYLHDHNIIHRDLKPENILLVDEDPQSQIKLTDFGLAKRASREGLKTFCGTPQYFAPEVLERKTDIPAASHSSINAQPASRYGFKADMWSLGVVLYIMLSASFPFEEENLYDQLRDGKYSVSGGEWHGVSSHAKHLVRSLMTLKPADRLDVTQALEHPWMKLGDSGKIISKSKSQKEISSQNNIRPSNQSATRTKTFCPVFWSNRPAFSATFSGSIQQKPTSGQPSASASNNPSPFDAAKVSQKNPSGQVAGSNGPSVHSWHASIEKCPSGADDIDDFSSDEELKVGGPKRRRDKQESKQRESNKKKKSLDIGVTSKNKKENCSSGPRGSGSLFDSVTGNERSDQPSKNGSRSQYGAEIRYQTPNVEDKKCPSTKKKMSTRKGNSKKVSLRVPVKTLPEMFRMSGSKEKVSSNKVIIIDKGNNQ